MWNVDCSQNTQTGAPLLYTYTQDANLDSNNFYCAYGPNGGNGDVTIFQLGADECPGQQVVSPPSLISSLSSSLLIENCIVL